VKANIPADPQVPENGSLRVTLPRPEGPVAEKQSPPPETDDQAGQNRRASATAGRLGGHRSPWRGGAAEVITHIGTGDEHDERVKPWPKYEEQPAFCQDGFEYGTTTAPSSRVGLRIPPLEAGRDGGTGWVCLRSVLAKTAPRR
jgi:hypothetical protein